MYIYFYKVSQYNARQSVEKERKRKKSNEQAQTVNNTLMWFASNNFIIYDIFRFPALKWQSKKLKIKVVNVLFSYALIVNIYKCDVEVVCKCRKWKYAFYECFMAYAFQGSGIMYSFESQFIAVEYFLRK